MVMLIKKIFSFFFISISLVFISSFLFVTPAKAQTNCSSENSNEPSSLRPYPGDPCNKEVSGALLCGNDLILTDQITVSPPAGFAGCQKNEGDPQTTKDDTFNCQFETPRGFSLAVDASPAELPIAGNTENKDLTDAEKVNEYVSWYLNGVINRTEDWPLTDKSAGDRSKIIDFSGPIRKLLPSTVQNQARTDQVAAAQGPDQTRHNQLVYCTYGFDSIVPDWTQFPGPCDLGAVGNALSWLTGTKKELRLSDWSGKEPPKEEDYANFNDYYKTFREWRGSTCLTVKIPEKISVLGAEIPIPVIGGKEFFFCFDNPTQKNYWADLYPFIPFTSTEDKTGQLTISQPVPTSTEVEVVNPLFNNVKASVLYFPHLEEDKGLAELLQTTYKAKGLEETQGSYVASVTKAGCKVLQLRTNEGDSLKGTEASGNFSYTAKFNCTFARTATSSACTKSVTFASQVKTQTPLVDEIWQKLVSGSASVVRRMFPKLGTGGLGEVIDYPTSTKANYSASGTGAKVANAEAEIYIPHLGGVSEYFLKGIQTMLRPKGFGDPITFGPTDEKATSCKGNAFAQLGPPSETTSKAKVFFDSYIKSRLTTEVVSAYAQAEVETGVPCEVLAGVHFMEGGNNPNQNLQNGGPLTGTLAASAIQAGHEIAAKVGGKIDSWESLIAAVARYNGEGNNNCGLSQYKGPCPPPWDTDNPYALAWIDAKHADMYLIYCWDFTKCPEPQLFIRPGALAVATEFYLSKK